MKKYLFIFLILNQVALAEVFKISGSLHYFEEKEGLLLEGCQKDCKALKTIKAHKKIDLKKIRAGQQFENSVGSDVCSKVYHGGSIIGVAENQDRRAFCIFDDKSMVEMNSLSKYLTHRKLAR